MCRSSAARAVAVAVAALAALAAPAAAQAQPPACRTDDTSLCRLDYNATNTRLLYEFVVQGKYFSMEYRDGSEVTVRCEREGAPELEAAAAGGALPAFGTPLRVQRVDIDSCGVAEYARLFRALNLAPVPPFDLTLANTGAAGPLAPAHLAGLAGVRSLTLRGAGAPRGPLLAQLPDLAALDLTSTRLPPGELDAPPPLLERVSLSDAGVTRVPAALLALPGLRWLTVTGEAAVHVEPPRAPSPLRSLSVAAAEGALLAQWAPPALATAYLARWSNPAPPPVPSCAALTALTLVSPAARALPAGWVARCPRLARLELRFATGLTALPAGLLAGASALTHLVLQAGSLTHLPAGLLDESPRLVHIDLSGNHLKELPSGALRPVSGSLLELNLSGNELRTEVGAALSSLARLRKLSLANNRQVLDLCGAGRLDYITVSKNTSPLAALSELEVLNLRNTNVTSVCSDWRTELPLLAELDLRGTRIASLAYEDLVYRRRVRSVVRLRDVPLRQLTFTAEDYAAAAAAAAPSATAATAATARVTVLLGGSGASLDCDCYLYWFARALEEGLLPVGGGAAAELRCAGAGGVLADTRPGDLLCPFGEAACPATPLARGCTCGVVGDAVLRVRCEGAGLARVPRVPPPGAALAVRAFDLLLADNAIAELTAADVPRTLRTLDLRNNSIRVIDEATAVALVGRGGAEEGGARRVRLAGNPLDCTSCRLAGARRVLRAGRRLLDSYEALRCGAEGGEGGGGLLADASEEPCPPAAAGGAVAAALAGLAAAAALVLAALGARRGRRRLKALLRRLVGRGAPHAGPALPYDVFLTFGPGAEGAALEVAARLEAAARPRRVLLQERDWLPPAWVPHCLALSVGVARRTVALLSPQWERWLESAEVRAAFEPAWRGALLLVLPPGGAQPADAALRRYARNHPHLVLRRGEPDFWRRLERALPPPAPAPAPAPTVPKEVHT